MKTVRQFPAMTAIRGIAAWWVVFFHLPAGISDIFGKPLQSLMSHGYLAVDLFFVLSGFVVALNYAYLFQNFKFRNCLTFYGLRLSRIYPLHAFMLILFIINPIAIFLFSTQGYIGERYNIEYFVMSIFLTQNWGFIDILAWNIPAWSISAEWAAYLLFPLLVCSTFRFLCTPLRALTAALALMVITAVLFASTSVASLGDNIPTLGMPRCLLEFAIGVCLFRIWEKRGDALLWEGNAAALAVAFLLAIYILFSTPDYIIFPLCFFILLYSLTNEQTFLARLLASRTLNAAGVISYSTYMVHYFIKDWIKFLLMTGNVSQYLVLLLYIMIVLIASIVLFHYVEVPGRSALRTLLASRSSRLPSGGAKR